MSTYDNRLFVEEGLPHNGTVTATRGGETQGEGASTSSKKQNKKQKTLLRYRYAVHVRLLFDVSAVGVTHSPCPKAVVKALKASSGEGLAR